MKSWNLLAGLVVLTLCLGLTQAADAPKPLYNDKCPISGADVDAEQSSEFKVEFCCKNCKNKFDQNSAKHLAKAAKAKPGTCIFNGRPAKTSTTLNIGVCCGGCKTKFDENPRKYIAKVKPAETEEG